MDGGLFDGFDWDRGNRRKCQQHGLALETIEAIFDRRTMIVPDPAHSKTEQRFYAIGKIGDRGILVVFTIRVRNGRSLVRPISARYMHAKEYKYYEEETSQS